MKRKSAGSYVWFMMLLIGCGTVGCEARTSQTDDPDKPKVQVRSQMEEDYWKSHVARMEQRAIHSPQASTYIGVTFGNLTEFLTRDMRTEKFIEHYGEHETKVQVTKYSQAYNTFQQFQNGREEMYEKLISENPVEGERMAIEHARQTNQEAGEIRNKAFREAMIIIAGIYVACGEKTGDEVLPPEQLLYRR